MPAMKIYCSSSVNCFSHALSRESLPDSGDSGMSADFCVVVQSLDRATSTTESAHRQMKRRADFGAAAVPMTIEMRQHRLHSSSLGTVQRREGLL